MDGHFSNLLCLLKNGHKSDSFSTHFEQHFNETTSRTDIRKHMLFNVVNHLNLIGTMKTFTKPNCNLCMKEILTILKNLRDKSVTVMNKNSAMYGACQLKRTFHKCFLFRFKRVKSLGRWTYFSNIRTWTHQRSFLIVKIS